MTTPGGQWLAVTLPDGQVRQDWVPTEQPLSPDGSPGRWHVVTDQTEPRWEWRPTPPPSAPPPSPAMSALPPTLPGPASPPSLKPGTRRSGGLFDHPLHRDWLAYVWALNTLIWVHVAVEDYYSDGASPSGARFVAMAFDVALFLGLGFLIPILPIALIRRAIRARRSPAAEPVPAGAAAPVASDPRQEQRNQLAGRPRARVAGAAALVVLAAVAVAATSANDSAPDQSWALCVKGAQAVKAPPAAAYGDPAGTSAWLKQTATDLGDAQVQYKPSDPAVQQIMGNLVSSLRLAASYLTAYGAGDPYRTTYASIGVLVERLNAECETHRP